MATLVSITNGNFTSSSTWKAVANESDSEAGTTATTTSAVASTAFTPGAITVDAILVKIAASTLGAGTFTVELFNSTGGSSVATVTVNVTDLTAGPGWYCFPITPTTLLAATNYTVRLKSSTAGTVTTYRTATAGDWSRSLRTTTTQAPASGDKLLIIGEHTGAGTGNSWTVTMDNTATTSFGPTVSGGPPQGICVGKRGTLKFGTSTSTAYYLRMKGVLAVHSGGTFTIGTSGTPMPSTSSAVLEFDVVANVDSGLLVDQGGTFNAYGASKTTVYTLMTADKAAAATVIALSATSGFLVSDVLAFASTTQTQGQCETKTILTVDSGTQVTLTAGLTNAHSGTSPTQAEVINLTRNVKIRGISTSLQGYILINTTGVFASQYTEYSQLGSNTANKFGISVQTTTGSFLLQYCSLHDFVVAGSNGVVVTGAASNNVTYDNNVSYNISNQHFSLGAATTGTNWSCTNSIGMVCTSANISVFSFNDVGGTVSNITAVGGGTGAISGGVGVAINENATITGSFSGITCHSSPAQGLGVYNAGGAATSTISTVKLWRNSSGGLYFGPSAVQNIYIRNLVLDTFTMFGNGTQNVTFSANVSFFNVTFLTPVLSGDTTFATTNGFSFSGQISTGVIVENGDFSTVTGIHTAHTNDINITALSAVQMTLRNTKLGAATQVANQGNMNYGSYIRAQMLGQVAGVHRAWYQTGTIDIDTVTFKTATPAEKLTPISSTIKLESGHKFAAVASGGTITFTAYVNKSAAYNGNQPRLILKKNIAAGISADVVLATASGGTGSWLTLTGTTGAVSDDAVLEACIDCDGTAGAVTNDDWTAV